MLRVIIIAVVVLLNLWRFGWKSMGDFEDDLFHGRVIYGEDNRQDLFEVDKDWKDLGRSTVALFDVDDLRWNPRNQGYDVNAGTYGLKYDLCEDEPFYDQPAGSFCSGFLVESRVVLTAGHCMRNEFNCERVRFVFGFSYPEADSDPLRIPENQVYRCQKILVTKTVATSGADYAVVLLDKAVEGFGPLAISEENAFDGDPSLTVVGYPKGLPAKIAHGGRVRNNTNPIYFVADLDTFGGNSGSAVFNSSTGLVEGVLVRGEKDFAFDQEKKCRRSYQCPIGTCRGEDVVRISEILKNFKDAEFASSHQ